MATQRKSNDKVRTINSSQSKKKSGKASKAAQQAAVVSCTSRQTRAGRGFKSNNQGPVGGNN
jgi:hypothetical protein